MNKHKGIAFKNNNVCWFVLGCGAVLICQKIMAMFRLIIQSGPVKTNYILAGVLVSLVIFLNFQFLPKTQKSNRQEINESETPLKWKNIR